MKRTLALTLAFLLALSANAYAAESDVSATSPGSITSSNSSLDVVLEGTVFAEVPADIITVLMPTQVYFNVLPDEDSWNKVLSPVINVSNLSSADVRISVTRAAATGADLTLGTPEGNSVRLGIAPESQISEALLSSNYLLRPNLNNASYVDLGLVRTNSPNNVAHLKVFGDAASGVWTTGDIFTVRTMFKVTM